MFWELAEQDTIWRGLGQEQKTLLLFRRPSVSLTPGSRAGDVGLKEDSLTEPKEERGMCLYEVLTQSWKQLEVTVSV